MATEWMTRGHEAWGRGALGEAGECYRRGLEASERGADDNGIARACSCLGTVAYLQGDLAEAEAYHRRSLASFERRDDQVGALYAWINLGEVALYRGSLAQADAYDRRALAGAESSGHQLGIAVSRTNLGEVACDRGDLTAAFGWCRGARLLARRIDLRDEETRATLGQARVRLRAGRLRAARALVERAQALVDEHDLALLAVQPIRLLAEIRLLQGDLDTAQAAADETLRLATAGGRRREQALAHRLLGQCLLRGGSAAGAVGHLRAALTLQVAMGAALEAARTRVVLATAAAAQVGGGGKPIEEARALLAEAMVSFMTSGATLDQHQASSLAAMWSF